MFANRFALVLLLEAFTFSFFGCHDTSKFPGPDSPFSSNGTRLYISDCNPFSNEIKENVSLVPAAADACDSSIQFYEWFNATWKSNSFLNVQGSLDEGYHLRFERTLQEAARPTIFIVEFQGLATHFLRRLEFPAGQIVSIFDWTENGVVSIPSDSARYLQINILDSLGSARFNVMAGDGSFLFTQAERTHLCEFVIDLGLAEGIGQPNQGVNFTYRNVSTAHRDSIFLDFTRGALVLNNAIHLGPQYGIVYLMSESNSCFDTAAFYALAPSYGYRESVLGEFSTASVISDGNHVWLYDLRLDSANSTQLVQIFQSNETILISRNVNLESQVEITFDQFRQFILIVARDSSRNDTVWGYATDGRLDTIMTADEIPNGVLFQGMWLQEGTITKYERNIRMIPFLNGQSLSMNTVPTELSFSFEGHAGLSYPETAHSRQWNVNLFDSTGNWKARYPVFWEGDSTSAINVQLLSADRIVIFAVNNGSQIQIHTLQSE